MKNYWLNLNFQNISFMASIFIESHNYSIFVMVNLSAIFQNVRVILKTIFEMFDNQFLSFIDQIQNLLLFESINFDEIISIIVGWSFKFYSPVCSDVKKGCVRILT
jgi:hypothetical protein